MRKLFFALVMLGLMPWTNLHATGAGTIKNPAGEDTKWKKDADGAWEGSKGGKNYWYKIDKNKKLWWSTNEKKWEPVGDDMWMDKSGHWIKIKGGKLEWSSNEGKTWADVPESKWEGSDGKWYKLDMEWTLWVAE